MERAFDLIIILLMFAPICFQLICGVRAANRDDVPGLIPVTLISITSQIVITIINIINTQNSIQRSGLRCGMPIVGVFVIGTMLAIAIVILAGLQAIIKYFIKRSRQRKATSDSQQTPTDNPAIEQPSPSL